MITIKSDDPAVEKMLRRLEALVLDTGSQLNESLVVCCKNNFLWLESGLPPDNADILVKLTEASAVPVNLFDLRLEDDTLVLASTDPDIGETQAAILEAMIALYNLTDKITTYKAQSPRIALRDDPETSSRLLAARPKAFIAGRFREIAETDDLDTAIIQNFLKSRVLTVGDGVGVDALLPFIAFANHHVLAANCIKASPDHPGMAKALVNSKPVPGSDEVMIRYTLFDALDSFLHHGFATPDPAFVRSVPLTLDFGAIGKVEVGGYISDQRFTPNNDALVAQGIYLPKYLEREKGFLGISWLLIPAQTRPNALRQVLAFLMKELDPGLDEAEGLVLLKKCEKEVLSANISFYEDLKGYLGGLKTTPVIEEAKTAVDIQLSLLSTYKPLEWKN